MVSILLLVKLYGKKRLPYTEEKRKKLVLFFFERMLKVLEGFDIYVATPDDVPGGDYVIVKDEWGDINKAITKAREMIQDDLLILPCDLPFVERENIDRVLNGVVKIVPSQDGGTNALFLPRSMGFETHFGINSFQKHIGALESGNLEYEIYESDQFRDIDTEEDVLWALEHWKDSEFSEFVRRINT
jgi:2-phospho-L-lactate guanylyltransferase